MKKGRKRTAALLVSLMLLSAFLPAGVMQVRAAEVIATVYGTILSGTTEELLMLSTAQGKMEIKLDSNTDASACKILLPGREIYVDVTYGSDAYLHAAKITNSTPVDASTIDYSSTVTVTGEIDDKTREDILYLDLCERLRCLDARGEHFGCGYVKDDDRDDNRGFRYHGEGEGDGSDEGKSAVSVHGRRSDGDRDRWRHGCLEW